MKITGYKKKHEYINPQTGRLSVLYLMDCEKAMPQFPENYFDLAVVDPPYGIGMDGGKSIGLRKKWTQSYEKIKYEKKNWDSKVPNPEYFTDLFLVSKHQIIWGGNYFIDNLKKSECIIAWDKKCDNTGFSDFEIAWTSFKSSNKICRLPIQVESQKRIHPTQKPVKLYQWTFDNLLPEGGKVIDTHLGSGSNRIAADKAGNIDFTAFEIDEQYFDDSVKRFENYSKQLKLQFA